MLSPKGSAVKADPLGLVTEEASFFYGSAVIGVALMVGILFFLMIAVERTFEWLGNQISKIFGRKKNKDPEDPAALVGSFKRYKN